MKHHTKVSKESWACMMDGDVTVSGQVEDLVNEVRWKLSVNAAKLFKVMGICFLECIMMDSTICLNPSGWIRTCFEIHHNGFKCIYFW